jgi:sugar phosphate isomerase/epimerase
MVRRESTTSGADAAARASPPVPAALGQVGRDARAASRPPTLTRRDALRGLALGAAAVAVAGVTGRDLAAGTREGGTQSAAGGRAADGGAGIGAADRRARARAPRRAEGGPALAPLGVQLYTLREAMQRDLPGTLARVAEIGYREVEFAGYFEHAPTRIRAALADAGLDAPSAHVPVEAVTGAWQATLDAAAEVGHGWLVVPSLPEDMRRTLDDWRRTADLFNRAGAAAADRGLRFGYHNHALELAPLEGRVPLELLCEATEPELVDLQVDLYWLVDGGGDPLAFFERCAGRIPLVHVKDRTADGRMVDVGAGAIDWAAIFARRGQAGIRHYFVEHDEPDDPFASVEASFRYLSALEVRDDGSGT